MLYSLMLSSETDTILYSFSEASLTPPVISSLNTNTEPFVGAEGNAVSTVKLVTVPAPVDTVSVTTFVFFG